MNSPGLKIRRRRQARMQSRDFLMKVASATRMTLSPTTAPLATVSSNVHKQYTESALTKYTKAQLYHQTTVLNIQAEITMSSTVVHVRLFNSPTCRMSGTDSWISRSRTFLTRQARKKCETSSASGTTLLTMITLLDQANILQR